MSLTTEQASKILRISLPISQAGLKQAFKRAALNAHPDHGGTQEKFLQLQEALECLKASPLLLVTETSSSLTHTMCGKELSSLGLGYPLTEAAITCTDCKGQGYHLSTIGGVPCEYCNGQGTYSRLYRPCPICFPDKRERVGEVAESYATLRLYARLGCRRCKGYGKVIWLQLPTGKIKKCHVCGGEGVKKGELVATLCYTCKGKGETQMWNPVLHRGLLNL
jgi:DnaJ-class molecular chaperone